MLLIKFLKLSDKELHSLSSLKLTIGTSYTSDLDSQTIKKICDSLIACEQLKTLRIGEAVIDYCKKDKRGIFSTLGKLQTLQILEIAGDNLNELDSAEFKFFVDESLSKLINLQELYLYEDYGQGNFDATDLPSLQLLGKTLSIMPYFRKLHLDIDFDNIETNAIEPFLKELSHIKDFVMGEANLMCVPDDKIYAFCCGLLTMQNLDRLTIESSNFHNFTKDNLLFLYNNLGKMGNLREFVLDFEDSGCNAEIHFQQVEKLIKDRQEKINSATAAALPESKILPLTVWCVHEDEDYPMVIASTGFYLPIFNHKVISKIIDKEGGYQQCKPSDTLFFWQNSP